MIWCTYPRLRSNICIFRGEIVRFVAWQMAMASAIWASSTSFVRSLQPLFSQSSTFSRINYTLHRYESSGCLFFSSSSNKLPKLGVYAQARRVVSSKTKGDEVATRKHPSRFWPNNKSISSHFFLSQIEIWFCVW